VLVQPDRVSVRAFVARTRRRLALRAAAEGAATGLVLPILLGVFGWPGTLPRSAVFGGLCVVIAILFRLYSRRAPLMHPLGYVEQRIAPSRNVITTAAELEAGAGRSGIHGIIVGRAAELLRQTSPGLLVPMGRAVLAGVVAFGLWGVALARADEPIVGARALQKLGIARRAAISSIDVTITSPSYAAQQVIRLQNPSRIEALAGSKLAFRIRSTAARIAIQTVARHDTLVVADDRIDLTMMADADGFVAVQAVDSAARDARRLIGITVRPDAAPHVKITAPARDVVLKDGNGALDIAAIADDDIALSSLKLRYTKVAGSGERFTFSEGEIPIELARADARHWTVKTRWPLKSLALDAGDMVVYRAVAIDNRPGASPVESDAFIAEVASPGGMAAPGFSLDPDQERSAVSQQMVILKTERLLAAKPTMAPEEFASQSAELAAEQRKVRAEFVFMLGGELEDAPDPAASSTELNEVAEAEGEADILAGRNANAGHLAMLSAIRSMSRAAAALTTADVEPALPHERAALKALESALSRARILLRALSTKERLDMTRRLTGTLVDAASDVRPTVDAVVSPRTLALRRALADVAAIGGATELRRNARELSRIAQQILVIDPSSAALQKVSSELDAASQSAAASKDAEARRAIDDATTALVTELRGSLGDASSRTRTIIDARLRGVLSDQASRSTKP
jgi:hypothetical protein